MMSSTEYRTLGQEAPANTNYADMLTVATGKRVVSSTITVANIGSQTAKYSIAVRPGGAGLANKHYIAKDIDIPVGRHRSFTLGLTLQATDVVSVKTSVADTIAFGMWGTEITP